jgi:hypothetical protein
MTLIDSILGQIHHLANAVPDLGTYDIPNPVSKTPPGGLDKKILDLLGYLLWGATAACVVGVIFVGARMALAHRGGNDANVGQLGWVLLGCILVGTASGIVNALI